jgi:phage FluMu gp28-like protein
MLGETTTVISLTQPDADEVLEKTLKHSRVLSKFGSKWARCPKPKNGIIELESGGRIISSVQTRGGRGFTGNIVLDEFAYYERPEKVWDGASASTRLGFKLWGLSTPNGIGNLWHQLFTDPISHQGYSLHQTTVDEAMAQGMPVDLAECWKDAHHDPRVFDQLYRGSFLDNDQQYLPSALLEHCLWPELTHEGAISPLERFLGVPRIGTGVCYAGLDIGKTVDLTALVIVQLVGNMRWVVHIECRSRTNTQDIYDLAALAFGPVFNCKHLCVDSTGLGTFPAERLVKKYGMRHVTPVDFGIASKEDMATGVFEFMQLDFARIPRRHRDAKLSEELSKLMVDLAALRRIVTEKGNVTYDAPHTSHGHADRAWAYALAMKAARVQAARGVVR